MKSKSGKFNSGQGNNSLLLGLGGVLVVLLLFLAYVSFIIVRDSNHDKEYAGHASDLRVLSQEIAKNAGEASDGKSEAFDQLKRSRDDFERKLNLIVQGNTETNLPPTELASETGVVKRWNEVKNNTDQILANQDTVLSLHLVAETLNETIPQLQVEYDDVVQILLEGEAPADQIAVAQRQSLLAERIVRSVNNVLSGDEDAVIAADRFGRDAKLFGRVLNGMVEGNNVMGISQVSDEDAIYGLEAIAEMFEFVNENVDAILETSPELFKVRKAANNIFQDSQALLKETTSLSTQFQTQAESRTISPTLAYLILGVVIIVIVLIGLSLFRESQARLQTTTEQNEQNQNARPKRKKPGKQNKKHLLAKKPRLILKKEKKKKQLLKRKRKLQ